MCWAKNKINSHSTTLQPFLLNSPHFPYFLLRSLILQTHFQNYSQSSDWYYSH
jgi:hypothetical protein